MRLYKNTVFFHIIVLCVAASAVAYLWVLLDYPQNGIDDANIFFVYIKNLANGHGLVYNVGGERVEGFTSLLWVLVGAVVYKVSPESLEVILLILNILLISFSAAVGGAGIVHFSKHSNNNVVAILPVLYVVFLLTTPTYLMWTTLTLMDNGVWSTLLLCTTLLVIGTDLEKMNRQFKLVFLIFIFLLMLTRPESFVYVPVFICIVVLRNLPSNSFLQALKKCRECILFFFVTGFGLTIFRIVYFGYPLPNTFYAKVDASVSYNLTQGLDYFQAYLTSSPLVFFCILSVAFLLVYNLVSWKNCLVKHGFLLPLVATVGLFLPILIGGDHFSAFRFYQNIYPVLLLCLIQLLQIVIEYVSVKFSLKVFSKTTRWVVLMSLLVLIVALRVNNIYAFSASAIKPQHEFEMANYGRESGVMIAEVFSDMEHLPSLGVFLAGGFKYTYAGEVFDLLGLNNTAMAHSSSKRKGLKNHASFDKTVFFENAPDVVTPETITPAWTYSTSATFSPFGNEILDNLYHDVEFRSKYKFLRINREHQSITGWFSNEFADTLLQYDSLEVIDFANVSRESATVSETNCFASRDVISAENNSNILLGDDLVLLNFEKVEHLSSADSSLDVDLYFEVKRRPEADYTVFVHVLDTSGKLVAQSDRLAGCDGLRTSTWREGETWRDIYRVPIPERLPGGVYTLQMGMYEWPSLERLVVSNSANNVASIGEIRKE